MSHIRTQLERLLAQRILVLDGAMGTMIQRHTLTEDDFRGVLGYLASDLSAYVTGQNIAVILSSSNTQRETCAQRGGPLV